MRISELYIESFAGVNDLRLRFAEGFNLIVGSNEKGKSTVMAFIRAMLFGFQPASRRLDQYNRRRYQPWNDNRMAGLIIFEHQKRCYRLERVFGSAKAQDRILLYDNISGEKIIIEENSQPGEQILQISESIFTQSCYVAQLQSPLTRSDDQILTLLAGIANDESMPHSYEQADLRLRKAQSRLVAERGSGGELDNLNRQKAELGGRLDLLQTERFDLRKSARQLTEIEQSAAEAEGQLRNYRLAADIILRESVLESLREKASSYRSLLNLRRKQLQNIVRHKPQIPGLNSKDSVAEIVRSASSELRSCQKQIDLTDQEISDINVRQKALIDNLKHKDLNLKRYGYISMLALLIMAASLAAALTVEQPLFKTGLAVIPSILFVLCIILYFFQRTQRQKLHEEKNQTAKRLRQLAADQEYLTARTEKLEQYIFAMTSGKSNITDKNNDLDQGLADWQEEASAAKSAVCQAEEILKQAELEYDTCLQKMSELPVMPLSEEELSETDEPQLYLSAKIKEYEQILSKIAEHRQNLLDQTLRIRQVDNELNDLLEKTAVINEKIKIYEERYQLLSETRVLLKNAFSTLRQSYGPKLNHLTAKIFQEITDNKAVQIKVDRKLRINLAPSEDGSLHEYEFFSGGTVDQVYLALRLAMAQILFADKAPPPLLLDDTLIQYDDQRARNAYKYLTEMSDRQFQILFFTCQSRFLDADSGETINLIKL